MKEDILKELKKKDFLSQSIMLNWLRSQTNITFAKEERFNKLLKDIIIEEVSQAINQTREETIREERKRIYCYVEERLLGSDDELLKDLSNIIFDKIN